MKDIALDAEHERMVLACITQCLWHTDFFFRSEYERRTTVEAYEAITGTPLPGSLHKNPNTKGY
jgi:hypothetical protein